MNKLKFGIFGGTRGMDFLVRVLRNHPYAEVSAICEKYEPLRMKIEQDAKLYGNKVGVFSDFDDFIKADIDAVIIANFANDHADYATKALESGINVFCESLPTQTMSEAVRLCEAAEKSGKLYAYGENYCYLPHLFDIRKLLEAGNFGELMHAEGNFINDCSFKWHMLTRGDREHWRNHVPSTFYCTHSIGPLLFASGRRAVNVVGMETQRMPHMARVGARSASAAMEIMQLDNGGMAKSTNGNYRRAYSCEYRFICEGGTVETSIDNFGEIHIITADNAKKGYTFRSEIPGYCAKELFPDVTVPECDRFAFADICSVNIFIQSLMGNSEAQKYLIDVYKALDMSTPGLLAYRSILGGSSAVAVPDFRNVWERDAYRHDHKSTDTAKSQGEDLLPSCRSGFVRVDDEVYERVANEFKNAPIKSGGN